MSLRKDGSQGLSGALWRVLIKIMFALQMVSGFSDRVWGDCAALYGVHWAWQGKTCLCKGTGSQRGLFAGITKGLYQWLAVCGIGLASIRA